MNTFPANGFKIRPNISGETRYKHILAGKNGYINAISPNTGKPLMQVAQFDLDDPLLNISWSGLTLLPLLYSWTCEILTDVFSYKIISNKEIKILAFASDGLKSINRSEPYDGYPEYFNEIMVKLENLTPSEIKLNSDVFNTKNDFSLLQTKGYKLQDLKPGHQVGGLPLLVVPYEYRIVCPECRNIMPLFSTIGNRIDRTFEFIGNDWAQMIFFVCLDCRVISAINQVC